MPDTYQLHPQLEKDTHHLGVFPLCDVLLMNDARYPWIILVPRRPDLRELYDLEEAEQLQLWKESLFTAQAMQACFGADKMNTAALGNVVEQLHVHHVARFAHDAVWPAPVWGLGQAQPYSEMALSVMRSQLNKALEDLLSTDG
jgi:diadenosine tetraphosphate (Ap4A) HIT family hydrolase